MICKPMWKFYSGMSLAVRDKQVFSGLTGSQQTPRVWGVTGATYQREVNRMFQKQIGTFMEVYIDDMLLKSIKFELHITHLAKAFQVLKSYNIKLNLAKCAFEVSAGKFLGFIVNN